MVEHIITSWSKRHGKKLSEDFRSASCGTVGLRYKEKYMSPVWILGWLHWCTVAFLGPLCVHDKCLIPYLKWVERQLPWFVWDYPDFSTESPTSQDTLRQTNNVVTLNTWVRCLFSAYEGHASAPSWDFKQGCT